MSTTDYKAGQREVMRWLTGYSIRLTKVNDLGMKRDRDGWEHFAWELTVENYRGADKTQYTFSFRQGVAHTRKPTLVDIMAALLSDAACVLYSNGFEDFCADLGYDQDSRKAEKLYNEILENNAKLCKLFRTTDLAGLLDKYRPLQEAAGL